MLPWLLYLDVGLVKFHRYSDFACTIQAARYFYDSATRWESVDELFSAQRSALKLDDELSAVRVPVTIDYFYFGQFPFLDYFSNSMSKRHRPFNQIASSELCFGGQPLKRPVGGGESQLGHFWRVICIMSILISIASNLFLPAIFSSSSLSIQTVDSDKNSCHEIGIIKYYSII